MAIFSLVVWTGPSLGPIVAGFLEMSKGWRWGFYVVLWFGAVGIVLMFTLPETHAPTILTRKAHMARQSNISAYKNVQSAAEANTPSLTGMYKKALTLPWILLFDTISFLCALYMFFVYTLQYMLFSIYPIVFQDIRGWNAGVGQLPLLGQSYSDCRRDATTCRRGISGIREWMTPDWNRGQHRRAASHHSRSSQ